MRVPAEGWKPEGFVPPAQPEKLVTDQHVFVGAEDTPVLVHLGGAVHERLGRHRGVGQASAMIQEMFPGKVTVVAAAGLVGLISLTMWLADSSGRGIG